MFKFKKFFRFWLFYLMILNSFIFFLILNFWFFKTDLSIQNSIFYCIYVLFLVKKLQRCPLEETNVPKCFEIEVVRLNCCVKIYVNFICFSTKYIVKMIKLKCICYLYSLSVKVFIDFSMYTLSYFSIFFVFTFYLLTLNFLE